MSAPEVLRFMRCIIRMVLNRRFGVVSAPGDCDSCDRYSRDRVSSVVSNTFGDSEGFDQAYTCIFVVELFHINKIREIYFIWFHCVGS